MEIRTLQNHNFLVIRKCFSAPELPDSALCTCTSAKKCAFPSKTKQKSFLLFLLLLSYNDTNLDFWGYFGREDTSILTLFTFFTLTQVSLPDLLVGQSVSVCVDMGGWVWCVCGGGITIGEMLLQWWTLTLTSLACSFLYGWDTCIKYLSWVYGVDRKICHEGHWSASRVIPSDKFFYPQHTSMIDTFSCIPFDSPHLIFKVELGMK